MTSKQPIGPVLVSPKALRNRIKRKLQKTGLYLVRISSRKAGKLDERYAVLSAAGMDQGYPTGLEEIAWSLEISLLPMIHGSRWDGYVKDKTGFKKSAPGVVGNAVEG